MAEEEVLDCRVPVHFATDTTEVTLFPIVRSNPKQCYHDGHCLVPGEPVFSSHGLTYCSVSCALADAPVIHHPDILLVHFEQGNNGFPTIAPPRTVLRRFGGTQSISEFRGVPEVPGVSEVPGVPEVPGVSKVPGVPEVPGVSKVPGVPEVSVDHGLYCFYDCGAIDPSPSAQPPVQFPQYFGPSVWFCSSGCMLAHCDEMGLPGSNVETSIRAGRVRGAVACRYPAPPRFLLEGFGGPFCLANFRSACQLYYVKVLPGMSLINDSSMGDTSINKSAKFCTEERSHYEIHRYGCDDLGVSAPMAEAKKVPAANRALCGKKPPGLNRVPGKNVCKNLPFFRKK